MRMPWGKYAGQEISTIPTGYIRWILDNLDFQGELREALECRLNGTEYIPRQSIPLVDPVDLICRPADEYNDD